MPNDSRITVPLEPATRRKVERLATAEGISSNEARNRLLREASDETEGPIRKRRYRLKPRKVGFGFDLSESRRLAAEMPDDRVIEKLKVRR